MSIDPVSGLTPVHATSAPTPTSLVAQPDTRARAAQWADDFRNEAKKSPIERIIDGVLRRHSLTKEQYEALPAHDRLPIDDEIQEAIRLAFKTPQKPGSLTDVVA